MWSYFAKKIGNCKKLSISKFNQNSALNSLLGRGLPGSPSCPRMLRQEPASWQPVIPNSCLLSAKRLFFEVPGNRIARKLFLANGKRQGGVLGELHAKFKSPYRPYFFHKNNNTVIYKILVFSIFSPSRQPLYIAICPGYISLLGPSLLRFIHVTTGSTIQFHRLFQIIKHCERLYVS